MTFASLLGNEELKAAWQHALRGRFPQSILLTGPKGIGKLTAARVLTMALLCESTGEKPCGQCAACRKVEQNYHSDVTCIGCRCGLETAQNRLSRSAPISRA